MDSKEAMDGLRAMAELNELLKQGSESFARLRRIAEEFLKGDMPKLYDLIVEMDKCSADDRDAMLLSALLATARLSRALEGKEYAQALKDEIEGNTSTSRAREFAHNAATQINQALEDQINAVP